ncbi:MAG: hypothetical protein ABR552_08440 [Actinomycetota bacterium]
MKRVLIACIVMATFVVPSAARADSATYGPGSGFQAGPSGGDTFNFAKADPATGQVTVARAGTGTPTNSLGCKASGGFAYLAIDHLVTSSVNAITVSISNYALDHFSWLKVTASIAGQDGSLATVYVWGPDAGTTKTVTLVPESPTGARPQPNQTLHVIFGGETSTACLPTPNVDGALATFTQVQIS